MEYVYAALLLHNTKQPITEENLKKVLEAAGASIDEVKIKALVSSLEGVNIDEVIKQAAVTQVTQPQPTEEKKEEKEESKRLEEAAVGLSALFG